MLCDKCGQRPATVQYTVVVNGQGKQAHLCAQCAQESGLGMQISDLFGDDMRTWPWMHHFLFENEVSTAPPHNGLRIMGIPVAFQLSTGTPAQLAGAMDAPPSVVQNGRPGCGAFDWEFAPLLRKHGHTPSEHPVDASPKTQALQRELDEAIAAEDYEKAARLRNQLRATQPPKQADVSPEVQTLQRELSAAIAVEDYEKAARLRDEIRGKQAI